MPRLKYARPTEPVSMAIPTDVKAKAKERATQLNYDSLTRYIVALIEYDAEMNVVKPMEVKPAKTTVQPTTEADRTEEIFNRRKQDIAGNMNDDSILLEINEGLEREGITGSYIKLKELREKLRREI